MTPHRLKPIHITRHACQRLCERVGITDSERQRRQAVMAFKRGVCVPCTKYSNSYTVREYDGFLYVFRGSNRHALVTVFRPGDIS